MVTHDIVIGSSYSLGERIAMHRVADTDGKDDIGEIIAKILKECGKDVAISTHSIVTDFEEWSSVVDKDKFFDNIELIDDVDEFIRLIKQDRDLIGLDVARYILKKIDCTHLKLEKLTYFCYADYLCKTGMKLFKDRILAYELGPIVETVYDKYKGQRTILKEKEASSQEEDDEQTIDEKTRELSLESRILFASEGARRLISIDETIEKYKDISAMDLVNLTHKKDTPWRVVGGGSYQDVEITDEAIKEYHKNEEI